MKRIKLLFFYILSEKRYLRLLHRSFYLMLDLNLLKKDSKFKYHYKVKEIIKEDDTILDIGANLGYSAQQAFLGFQAGIIEPVDDVDENTSYFSNAQYSSVNQRFLQNS